MNTTICAISTAPGTGGIAVARISGPEAVAVADRVWRGRRLSEVTSHTAHLGAIVDPADGEELDRGVATVYRGPHSFTGEDVVELSVHGSRWIQRELINLLIRQGAVMAEPGEFTRRAFAAGRMDLAEAEAVADVIGSTSRAAHRLAMTQMRGDYSRHLEQMRSELVELAALLELELDFSEEDVEFADRERLIALGTKLLTEVDGMAGTFARGQAIKEGIPVAIVGATNAGKSTLLNRLVGDDRAIVSDIHGTTRDVIEDTVELGGYLFRLTDTAGLRHTDDPIEALGIERSHRAAAGARIVLWVIDPTDPQPLPFAPEGTVVAVVNKADLGVGHVPLPGEADVRIDISAKDDADLTRLTDALVEIADRDAAPADHTVTNARHYQALTLAADAMRRTLAALEAGVPADLVAQDLREAVHHLSTITAPITTPALLSHIFSHFCIGK